MNWQEDFEEGRRLGSGGELQAAADAFRRAVAAAPDEPHPHYDLGFTLYRLGDVEGAVAALRETNRLVDGFFVVQMELAIYEAVLDGTISKECGDAFRWLMTVNDAPMPVDDPEALEQPLDETVRTLRELAPDFPLTEYFFATYAKGESVEAYRASLERCLALGPDDTTRIFATRQLAGTYPEDDPLGTEILRGIVEALPDHPQNAINKLILEQRMSADAER